MHRSGSQIGHRGFSPRICAVTACSSNVQSMTGTRRSHTGSADEFFALLRFTRVDGPFRTGTQLMTEASNVVRGRFSDVQDGRVIDFATGASNPLQTAVFALLGCKDTQGPPARQLRTWNSSVAGSR